MRAGRHRWRRELATLAVELTIAVRGRGPADPTRAEIERHLWCENTQRLGVRFTEAIRDAWRGRWLRISRSEH